MKKIVKVPLKILGWFVGIVCALLILIFVGEKLFFGKFFFGGAKMEMKVPGTWTEYVQQGFDRLDDGKFLVSAYSKKNESAAIYVLDDGDETLCKLQNADGTPYLSHAGGLTHYKDWVYVATDNHVDTAGDVYCAHDNCNTNLDRFLLSDVLDGDGKATLVDSIVIPNRLAYVSIYDNTLYAGAFHRAGSKYLTPIEHHFKTPAGDKNTALMMVYDMNPTTGKPKATPTKCYSTTSCVQGMCLTEKGNIVLSTSWGVNVSHLYQYNASKAEKKGTVSINNVKVPVYHLDSSCLLTDTKTPPMAEELVFHDGRVYILTESASMKYIFGKIMSGNHVYSYPLN